ncbi:MAG TPA: YceI family protein [Caulobacteraceae bacterium]
MRAILAGIVLLTAAPAHAAPPSWVVDKGASKVVLSSSFDGEPISGTIRRWDAQIRFDPKDLKGSSARVSLDTASVVSGDADQEAALPHQKWFWSQRYPQATFVSRSFKPLGGRRYAAVGDLTIRGVTKPLTLPFTLAITGDTAKMNAAVDLNRLAFGVGQDEWKATDVIPAKVKVTIALTAHRAK